MAGKEIKELGEALSFTPNHPNHLFVYQSATDDKTYKVKLNDIIYDILNSHISVGTGMSYSLVGTILTLSADKTQTVFVSTSEPSNALAGDLWIHSDTTDTEHLGDIDKYVDNNWVFQVNLKGHDGTDGVDGLTPSIDSTTKHWIIGETDTGVVAEGVDGAPGAPGTNGTNGTDGYSISASAVSITGGTEVTIHSTDPNVSDIVFDVMDGSVSGYIQGDGISIVGSTISVKLGTGLQINSQTGNIDVISQGSNITVSNTLTLSAAGWSNNSQTVTFSHDTNKRNVIDITSSEIPKWAMYGIYAVSETSSGITFNCKDTPTEALTFKVTSMEVTTQ